MNETEEIKELAQKSLDEKWNDDYAGVSDRCAFCEEVVCERCLCPRIICRGGNEPNNSLIGYFEWKYNGALPLKEMEKRDRELMIQAMKELAAVGGLSTSTIIAIKEKLVLM